MALDPTRLSTNMRAAILAAGCGAVDGAPLTALCNAIAASIVTEIIGHATVPALGLVSPPGTVGGPVTGSAVVT
jgi:hypothetical protein